MSCDALNDENRAAVIAALLALALNENAPAGARVAAARLYLAQFEEQAGAEADVLVVVDEASFVKTV